MSPFVMRPGKRIEVVPLDTGRPSKRRRKTFKVEFVQVPARWIEVLSRSKNAGAWQLAVVILAEAFRCKHLGGEIILSAQVTQMPATTRQRAARKLVSLGLIQLEAPNGKRAPKVLAVRESG
jgi:hypothetical protein